ncbi:MULTISPECIES: phosphorylase [Cupriavidus]|uniref:Phosphorylase n=1 Tax=Cupriavidus pauculus TaxID=82633 RepID=A0A3G8H501_9BURK|nr:phosphorylase [Cupriavidus pauculus]AZG15613.1 phosphorylase [Cupriavidus pauculus]
MSSAAPLAPVLAVCGMDFEARIAQGPGVQTLYGQRGVMLARALDIRLMQGCAGLISVGVAGGLDPTLTPGTVIVATAVRSGEASYSTAPYWTAALRRALPHAVSGLLAGSDTPVLTVADKTALHEAHGALAVDMESHVAARAAQAHGIPFAALRVVLDPADRAVPPLAFAGMAADGSTDVRAVMLGLLKAPHQLGGLLRLGRDASQAKAALTEACRATGAGFALPAVVAA